jgi:hypothetical protein
MKKDFQRSSSNKKSCEWKKTQKNEIRIKEERIHNEKLSEFASKIQTGSRVTSDCAARDFDSEYLQPMSFLLKLCSSILPQNSSHNYCAKLLES